MKLIINADDFGLSKAVNYGIIEAHKQGVVTSTTALVTADAFTHCKQLALENPALSVGIHLNITLGRPLLKHVSLVDENNNFFTKMEYIEDFTKSQDELYLEWRYQIEYFIEVMGVKPTHIDSHHHVHMLPKALPIVQRLAKEYDLPIRGDKKVELNTDFYGNQVSEDFFDQLPHFEMLEVMVHPAYVDTTLIEATSYALDRLKEYDILTLPSVREKIKNSGYTLISYKEVK